MWRLHEADDTCLLLYYQESGHSIIPAILGPEILGSQLRLHWKSASTHLLT